MSGTRIPPKFAWERYIVSARALFAVAGLDLRGPLRGGAGDDELRQLVSTLWQRRADHYSEVRASLTSSLRRIEMSYVGG